VKGVKLGFVSAFVITYPTKKRTGIQQPSTHLSIFAAQTPPVKASSQIYLQVVLSGTTQDFVEWQLQLVFHIMNAICLLIQNNTCSIFQIICRHLRFKTMKLFSGAKSSIPEDNLSQTMNFNCCYLVCSLIH
jgi:hypothetical protein